LGNLRKSSPGFQHTEIDRDKTHGTGPVHQIRETDKVHPICGIDALHRINANGTACFWLFGYEAGLSPFQTFFDLVANNSIASSTSGKNIKNERTQCTELFALRRKVKLVPATFEFCLIY
jgi:hypothetical protein